MSTGIYNATPPTLVDGQTVSPQVDASGNLKVALASNTATGASAEQVQGNVAAGSADSGNPVKAGGKYVAAGVTLIDGNRGDLQLDSRGYLLNNPSGNVAAAVADSGNPIKVGGKYNATQPTYTDGNRTDLQAGLRGSLRVELWGANAGSNLQVAGSTSDGITASASNGYLGLGLYVNGSGTLDRMRGNTTGLFTVAQPTTSGGLSISRLIAATSGVIKASAGQLYSGTLTNTNAAIRYLQIYNKATAGTLSTDTPALTIPLPPNATVMVDFQGIGGAFATGISWQFTTDDIAIPTTAGTATDIHGFVTFK